MAETSPLAKVFVAKQLDRISDVRIDIEAFDTEVLFASWSREECERAIEFAKRKRLEVDGELDEALPLDENIEHAYGGYVTFEIDELEVNGEQPIAG